MEFTATPSKIKKTDMEVQMTLKMAEKDNLIKPQHLKQTYEDLYVDTMSSEEYYKNNISLFLEHKSKMKEILKGSSYELFNPLMLVQISNKTKINIEEEIEEIKIIIDNSLKNNLTYYIWNYDSDKKADNIYINNDIKKSNDNYYMQLTDEKVRQEISNNNNLIDIVFLNML